MQRQWIGSALLLITFHGQAISVGNLTFSLPAEQTFVAKRVVNNNQSARLYRLSVVAIDRPGEKETRTRVADGEILFAPRQLTLQAGEGEYFKFYYRGPQDNRERYYRVSFREIPTQNHSQQNRAGARVSMEPVVVVDTLLAVRPRQTHFKWIYDKPTGTVTNSGNTWFKLLVKPACNATEEQSSTWYLRPGDVLHNALLKKRGETFIIYNDRFIRIATDCQP